MLRSAMWRTLFAALLVLSGAAQAQNVQNFRPTAGTWNYFSVEGGRVAKHLEFVPSLTVNYGNKPLNLRDADGNISQTLVEHLVTGDLMFVLGLWDYAELAIDIPVVYADGDLIQSSGVGLGDIRILPKVAFIKMDDKGPGFGVAIAIPINVPTGDKEKFSTADQVTVNPKLILEARAVGFSFAVNGGVRFRPDQALIDQDRLGGPGSAANPIALGTEATYGAAMAIDLGSADVKLLGEVYGAASIEDVDTNDAQGNPLEALAGIRIFTDPGPVITFGGGMGIVAEFGAPIWRGIFQFAWHDRNYDRDLDGILDDVDGCPDDPEDKDNFEDSNGCPDPDNDNDGVLDGVDNCPLDPEDKDGFEDADGCPDPDNDQDKILDVNDKCPDQAENYNNWKDEDGCPETIPDTDGDGLLDPDDKCPMKPEDKDGFQDTDGCPDPDNDNDKILDINDKCPNQPETINQFEDTDGCPDVKPTLKLVKITREKIEILEKVYFKTAKAKIKRRSYDVLNEVAEVLISHKYIKQIQVEGHTDSVGPAKYNKRLSQKRAEAVREYLIDRGVQPERLTAMGFGEDKPIDSNKNKAGRAMNRRVEFTITETETAK